VLRNIFTQGAIDARLIAFAVRRMALEPGDHVGVGPQRELLLDGPKKHAAPRTAPTADFRHVPRIDLVVWQCGQRINLRLLRGREPIRTPLLQMYTMRYIPDCPIRRPAELHEPVASLTPPARQVFGHPILMKYSLPDTFAKLF